VADDYLTINRSNWDERAPAHAASPGYALDKFVDDPTYLSDVVRFDLPRLGEIGGLRGVHLQCHIGTDTVSLARLGARMTGVDFSPAALAEARQLTERIGLDIDFVESDVYSLLDALEPASYDLVFTGIGALCWLPDIRRWAKVVAGLLRPGGRLFLREGHPVLWSIDETRDDDALAIEYAYFQGPEPLVSDEPGTYVETDTTFKHTVSHSWNHGLGEVVSALLEHGMQITMLVEHDSVPWQGLPGMMTDIGGGEWQLTDRPSRLPHTYTLQAVRASQ
jgi:SAM-dependent methyltransferase